MPIFEIYIQAKDLHSQPLSLKNLDDMDLMIWTILTISYEP